MFLFNKLIIQLLFEKITLIEKLLKLKTFYNHKYFQILLSFLPYIKL